MRLGICTRYGTHEATYAAIRMADAAESLGADDVSLFTMTQSQLAISPKWDARVQRGSPFSRWSHQQDHILWTAVPHAEQLRWVKQQKKRTSLLVLWHELSPQGLRELAEFDCLLCPSTACYEFLRSRGLTQTVCLPWDCGQPLYIKPRDYHVTRPRVLLPLWDGNARRSEMTTAQLVELLLKRHADLEITLACNSSTISSAATRRLGRLPAQSRSRLRVARGTPPAHRFLLFQSHDLTLYPSHFESTGMTVIQSLEMSTPIVAFSFRPLTEILNNRNSVTVACAEEINDIGMPRAVPDYEGLSTSLYHLLNDPEFLSELQFTALGGIRQRREAFANIIRTAVL